jgi:hypothetical protein
MYRGIGAKFRNIAAERQFDNDRIVSAVVSVVLLERAPQPAGLHAHDWVGLRIEICVAAKRIGGDGVGLEAVAAAGQSFIDNEGQKIRKLGRFRQNRVRDEAIAFAADSVVVCSPVIAFRRCHMSQAARRSLNRRVSPSGFAPKTDTTQ